MKKNMKTKANKKYSNKVQRKYMETINNIKMLKLS